MTGRGMPDGLWTEVEPSLHAHEREALDFVRRRLPNNEPWRAWSDFTFVDSSGRPSEVDLLVVAPSGIYLIEIKSYPDGKLEADPGTWRWHRPDGNVRTYDSPFIAADAKAKRLKSLLLAQKALRRNVAPPKTQHLVPALPLSKEAQRLEELRRTTAAYRLVFGQPRQEDLVSFLQQRGDDIDLELFRIDLRPGARGARPT
jgi:hypothetical protein